MKRKILFLLALFALTVSAENIPVDKARQMAVEFFRNNRPLLPVGDLQMVYDGETAASRANGEAPALYVFDNPQGKGFVIVSGDDLAHPVLGYSYENDFPADNLPVHIEKWLESLKRQINDGRKYGVVSTPKSRSLSRAGTPVVELETAQWDQDKPYNKYCPTVDGKATPTGCLITATAILMKYHEWPKKGKGTLPGYTTATKKINMPPIELGHEYLWDKMAMAYAYGYTEEQADQVARLMADLGTMLAADYVPGGTGAAAYHVSNTLPLYMDYDESALYRGRCDYMGADWHAMMKNELQEGRPILYSGFNDEAGHSFILDGYTTDDYYSVNWGWGSYCNGYFLLEALEPQGSGTGGNGDHYNFNQAAVTGLMPNKGNAPVEIFQFNAQGGMSASVTTFVQNQPFLFSIDGLYNWGRYNFSGWLKFALTDKDGKIKQDLVTEVVEDWEPFSGWSSYKEELTITVPIEIGDRIRAFFKSETAKDWTLIKGGEECTWELLVAEEFTLAQATSVTFAKDKRTLRVKTKQGATVVFADKDGKELSDICKPAGAQTIIDAASLPAGTYLLKVTRDTESLTVKIKLGESQK